MEESTKRGTTCSVRVITKQCSIQNCGPELIGRRILTFAQGCLARIRGWMRGFFLCGYELALIPEVFSQGGNPDTKSRTPHLEILNARTMLQLVLGSQL